MELRQLNTMVRAARMESFSRAAESLGYTQSAVTVQIRQLEEELGVRLFDRLGKRVRLTEAGERFLAQAERILNQVEQARQVARPGRELRGHLRLGLSESLCYSKLPAIFAWFRREHPGVTFSVYTGSPEQLLGQMERGETDLTYLIDDARYDRRWVKCLEEPEEIIFVTAESWAAEEEGPYPVEQLLRRPVYLTERDANYRRALDRYLARRKLELLPTLEIGDTAFLVQLLEETGGVSLLPRFAVEKQLEQGSLHPIPVRDFQVTMYRQLFHHRDKWLTGEMEAFVEAARGEGG